MSRHRVTPLFVFVCIIVLLLGACRGAGSLEGQPEASLTPEASATSVIPITPQPRPTLPPFTPVPEPTGAGPGRIIAILEVTCGQGATGIQLTIAYGGRAQGGTLLSHVVLMVDGDLEEDSGLLAQRDYRLTKYIAAAASSRHVVQVVADGTAAPSSAGTSIVNCPRGRSGPRV